MSLHDTVQKISPQSYKTFCFFTLIMYILFCGANQKKVLQNEIKDIALEASNLSITFFFNYFL